MEQVNLLTMIFTTPALGQAQPAQKAAAGLPGAQFELALQRQLWQGSVPVFAGGGKGAAALTGQAGAWLLQPSSGAATAQTLLAQTSSGADASSLAMLQGLLNALASSLLAVLGVDGKQAQSAAQQSGELAWPAVDTANAGPSPTTQAGQALAANLAAILDAGSGQTQSATPAGDAQWANAGASGAQVLMARLLNLWPQLAAQLQTLVQSAAGGELKVQLSWPSATQATASATATPWSMAAVADGQAGPGTLPVDLPPGTRTGYAVLPVADATGSPALAANAASELSGAPASIRWFSQAAGSGQVAAGQVAAATAAAALPAIVASTEVVLPEGLTLTVAIAKTADLANGAQYSVQLSQSGAEPVVLEAQLTIQRIATPFLPGTSRPLAIGARPTLAMPSSGLTATPQQSAALSPDASPPAGLTAKAIPGAASLPFSGSASIWQADAANGAVAVATPALDYTALSIDQPANVTPLLGTSPQRAKAPQVSVQLSGGTLAGATAGLTNGSSEPQAVAVGAGYQPVLKATPMVTTADGQAATNAQDAAAWSADEALMALTQQRKLSSPEAATIVRRLVPVASLTAQSTSELGQLPAVAVATGSMPAQLLQFVDAPLQVRPYAGLQYLELTQQLMAEAARARAAGSGLYSARLDLNPPELGQLYVNISVRGDTVAMQLAVVTGTPKEMLRESLNALRESLAEAGLEVVELRVVTLDDQPDKQQREQQQSSDDESPVVKTTPSLAPAKSTPFISQLISAAPAVNFSP